MKVAVVGRTKKAILGPLKKHGFTIVTRNPELIISFGGDGTSLYAERVYSGIPRVLIRHSKTCNKCQTHDYEKIFHSLLTKNYKIIQELKIEGVVNNKGRKIKALNEIDVHNQVPHAARLQLKINGKIVKETVIGDGILVSTPHGSTGYFKSITRKEFNKGLGIAFNNSVTHDKPIIVDENAKIEIKVIRGPALLVADNDHRMLVLKTNDSVTIRKSSETAKIIKLKEKGIKIERGNFVKLE